MCLSSLCSISYSFIQQYLESPFSPLHCPHPGPGTVYGSHLTGLRVSTSLPIVCSPHTARRILLKSTTNHGTPGLEHSRSHSHSTPLQPHLPTLCPSNTPATFLPQDICTCPSARNSVPLNIHKAHCFTSLRALPKCHLSERPWPPSYLKMRTPPTSTSSLPLVTSGLITSCARHLSWCLIHDRVLVSESAARRIGPGA